MESYKNIKYAPLLEVNQHSEEISFPSAAESIHVFLDRFLPGDFSFSKQHWHRTMQFNVVLEGILQVSVNGEDFLLKPGEGIFVNSNVIHCLNKDSLYACSSYSFQIPAVSICSDRDILLYSKYIAPVVNNLDFSHILFNRSELWHEKVLELLSQSFILAQNREFTYELQMKNLFCSIWILLLKHTNLLTSIPKSPYNSSNTQRMKEMLSYIHVHYAEKLTLSDIANSANISIAECNRCFHKFLKQTPFEYVTRYRTLTACQMLTGSDLSISEIMEAAGFREPSYFYRTFRSYTGKTPRKYRIEFRA